MRIEEEREYVSDKGSPPQQHRPFPRPKLIYLFTVVAAVVVSGILAIKASSLTTAISNDTSKGLIAGIVEPVRVSVDLGRVFPSLPSEHVDDDGGIVCAFVVKNPTSQTVTFEEVKKSCGCTKVALQKKILGPGEEAILEMAVDVRDRNGLVAVFCDLPNNLTSPWRYSLAADVFPSFVMDHDLLYLGRAHIGEKLGGSFSITAQGPTESELPRIVAASAADDRWACRIEPTASSTVVDGAVSQEWMLFVSGTSGERLGINQVGVEIDFEIGGKRKQHSRLCTWRVDGPYRAIPSIVFAKVSSDDAEKGSVNLPITRLSRTDGKDVLIKAVTVQHQFVSVEPIRVQSPAGPCIELRSTVHFSENVPPYLSGTITVELDDGASTTIKIPYACLSKSPDRSP